MLCPLFGLLGPAVWDQHTGFLRDGEVRRELSVWAALVHLWCSRWSSGFGWFNHSVALFNSCYSLHCQSLSCCVSTHTESGQSSVSTLCLWEADHWITVAFYLSLMHSSCYCCLVICLSAVNTPDISVSLLGWKSAKCIILWILLFPFKLGLINGKI